MKAFRCCLKTGRFVILSVAILCFDAKILAQTAGIIPVVTIHADQPIASITPSGANSPGVFTVTRWGDTNLALDVYYQIGGTASNGVDYAQISNWVTIPAGVTSNSIVITSLHTSSNMSDKTVVLQLAPPPVTTPVNYEIGAPDGAEVYVTGIYTNPVPWVEIVVPTNGEVFPASPDILIEANAGEKGFSFPRDFRYVTRVQFFAGTNYLGGFADAPPWMFGGTWPQPQIVWSNSPAGNFILTAIATDNADISATSAPVNITVLSSLTNFLPVSIISPPDGASFYAPTNIQIIAKANDPDGFVTNVEFFAGTTDLGPGISVVLDPPGIGGVTGPVYLFNWLNVPPGKYPLTAVATDNGGATGLSDAVNITVLPGPLTNLPPVVRMVSPANGKVFFAPVNIPLFAYVNYPADATPSVEFFDGTNRLGPGQPVSLPMPFPLAASNAPAGTDPYPPTFYPTNLFYLFWTNAPVGTHGLTAGAAIAFLDHALVLDITSAPVKITVLPSPPPPTNRPPIVSIVATDPVAIEGTNSWVWPGETNSPPTWTAWPTAVCRCFTNCGPKTATFTVRRFGATNDDLTVPYDIGGTASNGVDYVALPGSVTIPAGERRALITIVPIDDGPPDVNKTVILTLLPDMQLNPLPGYVLGFPNRAAAIIIDGDGPRPVAGVLPGGCFHLVAPGPDAAWFCVQYSTDLIHWTSICTNQVVNGSIDFVDPDASESSSRFYRALPLMNASAD